MTVISLQVVTGLLVTFPAALVVLLIVTRNMMLSSYAVVTLIGVVSFLLAFVSGVVGSYLVLSNHCAVVGRWGMSWA